MMEMPAPKRPSSRLEFLLRTPWVARLLATLGIAVMMGGLLAPIAGRDVLYPLADIVRQGAETWTIANPVVVAPLFFHTAPLPVTLGLDAVYTLITFGGLALLPLLWRPLFPTRARTLRWLFALWLFALTVLVVARMPALGQFLSTPPPVFPPLPPDQLPTIKAAHLLPGVAVFPLGVVLSTTALVLLIREPLPRSREAPAELPASHLLWAARLALTAGALVWGVGFYLMPEAVTAACPPISFSVTQFAHGACAGLDSDQVLTAALYSGFLPPFLHVVSPLWNYELLVAAGAITVVGGWTRQLVAQTLVWLSVWPVVALAAALVDLQGVSVIAQHGYKLIFETGPGWHVAPGMVITFVGIGLVALGQVGLWSVWVQQRSTAKAR